MMLTHVTIVIKDENKAVEFYTQKKGFEKRADYTNPGQPRWLTVGPKRQPIEMVLWQVGMGSDPNLLASHKQSGIGTRWVLEVDDVRNTFGETKARGVKFLDAQPREGGWGFSADLVDSEGNHFTIHETRNPSATADWAKSGKKAYRTNT